MHQYRHVLARMRLGDTDGDIARLALMGRRKAAYLGQQAHGHGWLDAARELPDEATLVEQLERPAPRPRTLSQVHPFAAEVQAWHRQGIPGTTINHALVRKYDFPGSYSSVRRFLQRPPPPSVDATTPLDFAPGETAQVDFGKAPQITDVYTGETIDTWLFCMVLARSWHLYAEVVRDQ